MGQGIPPTLTIYVVHLTKQQKKILLDFSLFFKNFIVNLVIASLLINIILLVGREWLNVFVEKSEKI